MKYIIYIQIAYQLIVIAAFTLITKELCKNIRVMRRFNSMRNHPSYVASPPATTDGKGNYYFNVKEEAAP
jgi:hypothetical protein